MKTKMIAAAFAALALAGPADAAKVLPIFNGSLTGGNSRFEGESTGFKGNASLELIPVVEFNDKWALMPVLRGEYSGTQTATQIIDEGTLFQQEQKYELEFRLIYRFKPTWKLSVVSGGGETLLKETSDERWGGGLYDHRSGWFGLNLEKKFPDWHAPSLFRVGLEGSSMIFPNYESLAAQQNLPLAGTNVLDVNSGRFFLKGESSMSPAVYLQYGLTTASDDYLDQRVVKEDGLYDEKERQDSFTWLNARVDWYLRERSLGSVPLKPGLSLEGELKTRRSNQNYFDTEQLVFIEKYYDYTEFTLTPASHLRFGKRGLLWSLGLGLTARNYPNRPAQDNTGAYIPEELQTRSVAVFTQVSYPIQKYLYLTLAANHYKATSNNEFEEFYNYEYESANYQAGVSFEF